MAFWNRKKKETEPSEEPENKAAEAGAVEDQGSPTVREPETAAAPEVPPSESSGEEPKKKGRLVLRGRILER
jgi:hypothetical protein